MKLRDKIKIFLKKNIQRGTMVFIILQFTNHPISILKEWIKKRKLLKNYRKPIFKDFNFKGNKFTLLLDPANKNTGEQYYLEEYEEDVLNFLTKNLKEESVFLDIGANIGFYTNLGGAFCKKGKVIAFEPISKIFNQNEKSIKNNGFDNVNLIKAACGEKEKEGKIYITNNNVAASSILNREKTNKVENIKIIKVDDLVKEKVDIVKMDIEGYEYYALIGMKKILERDHPKMIIELNIPTYESIKKGMTKKLLSFLESLGYSLFVIENGKMKKDFFKEENIEKYLLEDYHPNIICT